MSFPSFFYWNIHLSSLLLLFFLSICMFLSLYTDVQQLITMNKIWSCSCIFLNIFYLIVIVHNKKGNFINYNYKSEYLCVSMWHTVGNGYSLYFVILFSVSVRAHCIFYHHHGHMLRVKKIKQKISSLLALQIPTNGKRIIEKSKDT